MALDSNQFIDILLPLPFSQAFTYSSPIPIPRGTYVEVPFSSRKVVGVVWDNHKEKPENMTVKAVSTVFEFPPLSKPLIDLIDWVSNYYMVEKGLVLKMVLSLPVASFQKLLRKPDASEQEQYPTKPMTLSKTQEFCAEKIVGTVGNKKFAVQVLEGVTGSGKTEVYFKGVSEALAQGKQALVLLPEIALTPQWLERFKSRFGFAPLLWNSSLKDTERRRNWGALARGEASVVVGARSALFLPYQNLGLIVVDEEHDASYKQESGVLYHARDMAVMRGRFEQCPVVLASATPSLETLKNILDEKYEHLTLTERHGEAQLPDVQLVDMKKVEMASKWISKPLFDAISKGLANQQQVLLFLNRRGYSPFMVCSCCGARPECPHCDATLVYHKEQGLLRCHYCNYQKKNYLGCESCQTKDSLKPCGPGVERLAEEVQGLFPEVQSVMISSDTMETPAKVQETFADIESGKTQLMIGTQMMAKGHHFPNLAVVGIIDGDLSLHGTDLRAPERTYQMLHQVSGRAGRAHHKGTVFIQTHAPENLVMESLSQGNFDDFLQGELSDRQIHGFPPFGRLAALILSSHRADIVESVARELAKRIPRHAGLTVWGPTPAILSRLKKQYRWRFLVKTDKNINIQEVIRLWLKDVKIPSTVKKQVDMDPYSFF
ncbi:MAG: primosomal protein N' [Alphaproteobacteria bacterium]